MLPLFVYAARNTADITVDFNINSLTPIFAKCMFSTLLLILRFYFWSSAAYLQETKDFFATFFEVYNLQVMRVLVLWTM